MTSLKLLHKNIDSNQTMKGLVEVYEEMSATTMRKIRDAILSSRDYYHGLSLLSNEVGADLSHLADLQTKMNAIIFLSSDEGMSGEIIEKVLSQFLSSLKADPDRDVFIAGKVGEDLVRAFAPKLAFTSLAIDNLATTLQAYHFVEIVFGQFESIARQNPQSRIVSATSLAMTSKQWAGPEISNKLKFLYEPSVDKISTVFGEHIFGGVIDQTIKEGELAKNASRLMHLDQALTHIEQFLEKDRFKYHKLKKSISSKKQHTQVVGFRSNKAKKYQRQEI